MVALCCYFNMKYLAIDTCGKLYLMVVWAMWRQTLGFLLFLPKSHSDVKDGKYGADLVIIHLSVFNSRSPSSTPSQLHLFSSLITNVYYCPLPSSTPPPLHSPPQFSASTFMSLNKNEINSAQLCYW